MFKTIRTLLVIALLALSCMGCARQLFNTALSLGAAYGISQALSK